jgi:hypothetical protein
MELEWDKGNDIKSKANSCKTIHPLRGACAGLFIKEGKGLITMPQMPRTNYPVNRVHDQGGNLVYYNKTPLYNASNKTLTHAGGDAVAFEWHLARCLRLTSLAFIPPKALSLPHLLRPSSGDLWYLCLLAKHSGASFSLYIGVVDSESDSWGLLEVALTWRQRLAPNSSPSKARFTPDEPNLWFLASSLPKASPPWVGVGVNLPSLVLPYFAKKAHTQYHHATDHSGWMTICVQAYQLWDAAPFLGA